MLCLRMTNAELKQVLSEKDKRIEYLTKTLFQEQNYCRSVYNHFLTTHIDKCNKILSELNQLETLATPHTLPTKFEVKTSHGNWLRSQEYAIQHMQCVQTFYDDQLNVYWNMNNSDARSTVPRPSPVLSNEPSSIFLQYLKPAIQEIQRLQQNLQQPNWLPYQQPPYVVQNTPPGLV